VTPATRDLDVCENFLSEQVNEFSSNPSKHSLAAPDAAGTRRLQGRSLLRGETTRTSSSSQVMKRRVGRSRQTLAERSKLRLWRDMTARQWRHLRPASNRAAEAIAGLTRAAVPTASAERRRSLDHVHAGEHSTG
jgi:hypothetical protein